MPAEPPRYVLDSFALLAYLEGEAAAPQVRGILEQAEQGQAIVFLSSINFGECLYIVERERGLLQAQATISAVEQLSVRIVDVDRTQVFAAAHLKASYAISYADAFAAALAQEQNAILLTGDPEFANVQHLVTIDWLPQ